MDKTFNDRRNAIVTNLKLVVDILILYPALQARKKYLFLNAINILNAFINDEEEVPSDREDDLHNKRLLVLRGFDFFLWRKMVWKFKKTK